MREEVLTQFYKTCRFEIRFLYTMPPDGQTRGTLAMDPESLLFLYNLRSEDLLILRNLRLVFGFYSGRVINFRRVIQHYVNVDVALASEKAGAKIVTQSGSHSHELPLVNGYFARTALIRGRHPALNNCQSQLLIDIRDAIRGVLGPVEPDQLKIGDLLKLVGRVEGVLRDTAERIKWW